MLPHFSSVGNSVFHRYSVSSFVVLGSALTEVALLPATGLRSALQARSCCVKSFAPASPSLAHQHEVPSLKRPHAADSYIVRYDYFLLVLHVAFREVSSGTQKKRGRYFNDSKLQQLCLHHTALSVWFLSLPLVRLWRLFVLFSLPMFCH
jgi:hypothetical protein